VNGGVVYGATRNGTGTIGSVVFSLTPSGTIWVKANIANFTRSTSGKTPGGDEVYGQLHADSSGNLYGTTEGGGIATGNCAQDGFDGCGVAFKLTKSGSTWTSTVLYSFKGGSDGQAPLGGLVADTKGNLYGVTANGGNSNNCLDGCGTIFELIKPVSGTTWTEKLLYSFQGIVNGATTGDGAVPNAPLVLKGETIYGTTRAGGNVEVVDKNDICESAANDGQASCGVVFRLSPPATGKTVWKETVLYKFTNGSDGSAPQAGLVLDSVGNLYGAAMQGGDSSFACTESGFSGCGVVFKLTKPVAPATAFTFSSLYQFAGAGNGAGLSPAQAPISVLRDKAGNLFGTAGYTPSPGSNCAAGSYYCGAVFELAAPAIAGGSYTYSQLHTFSGNTASDNALPAAPLTVNVTGTVYGVTMYSQSGTVFELTDSGY